MKLLVSSDYEGTRAMPLKAWFYRAGPEKGKAIPLYQWQSEGDYSDVVIDVPWLFWIIYQFTGKIHFLIESKWDKEGIEASKDFKDLYAQYR